MNPLSMSSLVAHVGEWSTGTKLMLLWVTALVGRTIIAVGAPKSSENLDSPQQRGKAMDYIVQILVMTFVLLMQSHAGLDFLPHGKKLLPRNEALTWGAFALQGVFILHVWEILYRQLVYRQRVGMPVLIHHLFVIAITQAGMSVVRSDVSTVWFFEWSLVFELYATIELPTFAGILLFRMQLIPKGLQPLLFQLASVQAFTCKTAVTFLLAMWYKSYLVALEDSGPLGYVVLMVMPAACALLYASQVYSCYVFYMDHKKCPQPTASSRLSQNNQATTSNNSDDSTESSGQNQEENDDNDDIGQNQFSPSFARKLTTTFL